MKRAEKEQLVGAIAERFKASGAVFAMEYRGLTVQQMTNLRKELRQSEAELKVLKNRLTCLAVKDAVQAPFAEGLTGPTAIIFAGADPISVAKTLVKFGEELEALKIKKGFLNGQVLTVAQIGGLAALPSKEELYAKLLGSLMAPITNFTRALHQAPQKLVRAFGAIQEKKEKEGGQSNG